MIFENLKAGISFLEIVLEALEKEKPSYYSFLNKVENKKSMVSQIPKPISCFKITRSKTEILLTTRILSRLNPNRIKSFEFGPC